MAKAPSGFVPEKSIAAKAPAGFVPVEMSDIEIPTQSGVVRKLTKDEAAEYNKQRAQYERAQNPVVNALESAGSGLLKFREAMYNIVPDFAKPDIDNAFIQSVPLEVRERVSMAMPGLSSSLLAPQEMAQIQAKRRQEQAVRKQAMPATAAVSELVGESLPAIALAPASTGIKGLAALGAAEGGAMGLAEADIEEDYQDRLTSGAVGAAAGAAGGVALPLIGGAARKGGELIGEAADFIGQRARSITDATPESQVAGALRRQFEEGGVDVEDVIVKRAELGPGATLADVDELRGLSQGAAMTTPGRPYGAELEARQLSQESRIMQSLSEITGRKADEYRGGVAELVKARSEAAKPLYKEAYETVIDEDLSPIIGRLDAAGAMSAAQRKAGIEGRAFDLENPQISDLDMAKRALDDQIGAAMRNGGRDEARALLSLKSDLLDQLDELSPAYKQARLQFAGDSAVINAAELGANVFTPKKDGLRLTRDELKEYVSTLSGAELDAFQSGVVKAVDDKLAKVPDTADNARRLWKDRDTRERIRLAFKTQSEFDEFMKALDRESAFTNTLRDLYQGSQTAQRMQGVKTVTGSSDEVPGGAIDMIRKFVSLKMDPEGQQALAKVLFDPATTDNQIRSLFKDAGLTPPTGLGGKGIETLKKAWPEVWRLISAPRLAVMGGAITPQAAAEENKQELEAARIQEALNP